LSLTLSESTTRDGLRLASRTPQAALRPNVLTLLLPRSILARDQLNPYLQGAQGKEVEQWQSSADHNVRLHKGTVHRGYADA
jgi:hypothetical protein